ncbi:MAG: PQQ-binding-like beta-propeller repeat protein [Candidatus Bathyarchaeales archaeon]
MQLAKNRHDAIFVLLLTAAMAISLLAIPLATAQTYPEKKTYAYIVVTPNPVGVGQSVQVIFGITDYLLQYPDGWSGLTVTVTKPDGTTETLGPYKTDATGSTGTIYMPTMKGTYKFQAHFPAQLYNWTTRPAFDPTFFGPVWYKASDSDIAELVVQDEALPGYPGVPLPTEYWSRPIDAQARDWSVIAGNWVDAPFNMFAPYNDAPETAHVLWAKPLIKGAFSPLGGGLAGGEMGEYNFETGDAYEGFFLSSSLLGSRWPVIIGGVLFFNVEKSNGATRVEREIVAVDLRTGEELWTRNWNNTRLDFGQLFYFDSYNYHAVYAYLWSTSGTTYNAYEASTGRWVFAINNVPSGTRVFGPNGEILIYTVNQAAGWMTLWNSTHVERQTKLRDIGPTGPAHGSWLTQGQDYMGRTLDGNLGYMWNKTIPAGLPGSVWAIYPDDMVVGNQLYGSWMVLGDQPVVFWAINLKRGQEGQLIYNKTWQKPPGDIAMIRGAVSKDSRAFTLRAKETRQVYGFNLDTGEKIWGPTDPMDIRSIYGATSYIAYDKLFFTADFAGIVYCYDVKTGKLLWTYEVKDPYGSTEMFDKEFGGDMWPITPLFISDGKLYIGQSEHSPQNPLPRGAPFICLDIETGEEVFRVNGMFRQTRWGGRAIIGDSIIATMDTYDQRIYAIGKGPSKTTVEASPEIATHGSKILVKGTVTDISPGTKDPILTMRFPHGVPAVADESMSDWMLYVYKQFPCPANVKGVEVVIEVLDPNNNYYEVARATTDGSGFYSATFDPPVPGKYTIVARFAGSKSYWGSYAETAIAVEEAPVAPEATPTPATMTETYVLGFGIAMLVAIIVIGLLIILMLRKR